MVMNAFLSFENIKTQNFDEAIKMIKSCKPPKTWNEMVADGVKGHIGAIRFFQEEAQKAKEKFHGRGLYFFITPQNEFYYIGRKNYNIMNRLWAQGGRGEKFRTCYVAVVDFPPYISFNHLKFYEAMFIVLTQPEANKKDGTGRWPREHFKFLRDRKITIEETYRIRTYH